MAYDEDIAVDEDQASQEAQQSLGVLGQVAGGPMAPMMPAIRVPQVRLPPTVPLEQEPDTAPTMPTPIAERPNVSYGFPAGQTREIPTVTGNQGTPRIFTGPTLEELADERDRQASIQASKALRNYLNSVQIKDIADADKALSSMMKFQAGLRWKNIYESDMRRGVPEQDASANAWKAIGNMVLPAQGAAALRATLEAAKKPPGQPTFVPANPATGQPAYFKQEHGGPTVQQVRAPAQTDYDKVHHVGDKALRFNRDGTTTILFDAGSEKVSALDRLKWSAAQAEITSANKLLETANSSARPVYQNAITDAKAKQNEIISKYEKPKPAPLTTSPAVADRQASMPTSAVLPTQVAPGPATQPQPVPDFVQEGQEPTLPPVNEARAQAKSKLSGLKTDAAKQAVRLRFKKLYNEDL